MAALPLGVASSFVFENFSANAAFWGAVGGSSRVLGLLLKSKSSKDAKAPGLTEAAATILLGAVTAAGMNGADFPWLSDFVTSKNPQLQHFIIGATAIFIVFGLSDIFRIASEKFNGGQK